jgi:superoxide dismutase, Cu-Zn family
MDRGGAIYLAGILALLAACGNAEQETGPAVREGAGTSTGERAAGTMEARAVLRNQAGVEIGDALIRQDGGGVVVTINARDLPPGERGLHFHEVGRCDPPAHQTAGSHFNPEGNEQHGLTSPGGGHAGDMENVEVASDGTVRATVRNDRVTLERGVANSLLDADGSALILHENRDDHTADAVTGARIACGVVSVS